MRIDKIIYQDKTKKGNDVVIRYPNKEDLNIMCDYINNLSKERTFILFQGEEITLEHEQKFLESKLEKITNNTAVMLLVFCNGKLIGISDINLKDKIEKHIGAFGISVEKDFRGEGIGALLIKLVIEEAIKKIPQLKIITLGVFSNNSHARALYKTFGFIEYGNLSNGVKLEDGYVDHIYMYKIVSR